MSDDLFRLAVQAIADTWAEKTPNDEADTTELTALVERATKALRGRMDATGDIADLLTTVQSRPNLSMGLEVSRRQVARWFEVPLDEFDQIPMATLQPEILFRHIWYEKLIASWFEEWGYEVSIGEELEGIEGADFIPDVYAELTTLHGRFQVAVTLFCGSPPNTWRVLGMLENIEAFTQHGNEFGERDIYLMVTPYKFLEQASTHIRIQCHQEAYYVVALEGNDLQDLERAPDQQGRKERLQELVRSVARGHSEHNF